MYKSVDSNGVKTSKKSAEHGRASGGTDTKIINKDSSLLISETIDDSHDEHDARHHVKLDDTQDILQSEVSSNPDAIVKFGEEKIDTHYSSHKKAMASRHEAVTADKTESSKTFAKAKARDCQLSEIDLDDDGFIIPHGRAKCQRHLKGNLNILCEVLLSAFV